MQFKFDKSLKSGKYSSKYFLTTKNILETCNKKNVATLRFKHFSNNVKIAGVEECLQLLRFCLPKNVYQKTKIYYLPDGTITSKDEPILVIEGEYKYFCHLENIIDSILSRRTSVATNVHHILEVVDTNKIIYMADRTDDYILQPYDGYSAYIAGIRNFVTEKQVEFFADKKDFQVLGTIPHALIQQFNGSLCDALKAYQQTYPKAKTVALIDFYNDCLKEIHNLKNANLKVDYVRIDTSKSLIDKSLQKLYAKTKDNSLYGVNHELVKMVRNELDKLGYQETKIIISSSINLEQIKNYVTKKTPIDIYGVGKSFINVNVNFTGDLIKLNGKYLAKAGRDNNIDHYLVKMKSIN